MNIPIHPLQIGTLATWLSVAAAGAVGLFWKPGHATIPEDEPRETHLALSDIVLGSDAPSVVADGETLLAADASVEETPESMEFPTPPEIPEVAEIGPLPDVPDLPPARPAVSESAGSRAVAAPSPRRPRVSGSSSNRSSNSSGGRGNDSSGTSNSDRMAAGTMPAPSYPSEARRKGQTGTVVVEFTVNSSGRVISAYAKSPSPWSLLNQEAVRTVRRWRFPPGGVMKLQRPIVFQLH